MMENIYDKIGVQMEEECDTNDRKSSIVANNIVNISPEKNEKNESEKKGCC